MIFDTLNQALSQLNLEPQEIQLYKLMLSGQLPISTLATNLGINRVRCYKLLDSLKSKGLVEKDGNNKYSPNPPSKVLTLLQIQNNHSMRIQDTLNKLLPELMLGYMETKKDDPVVRVKSNKYEFIFALDNILNLAKEGEIIYHFGENDNVIGMIGEEYTLDWIKRRVEKKVEARLIAATGTVFASRESAKDIFNIRQSKFIPIDNNLKHLSIAFSTQQIVIFDSALVRVITINDPNIARLLYICMNLCWNSL